MTENELLARLAQIARVDWQASEAREQEHRSPTNIEIGPCDCGAKPLATDGLDLPQSHRHGGCWVAVDYECGRSVLINLRASSWREDSRPYVPVQAGLFRGDVQ